MDERACRLDSSGIDLAQFPSRLTGIAQPSVMTEDGHGERAKGLTGGSGARRSVRDRLPRSATSAVVQVSLKRGIRLGRVMDETQ